MAAEPGLQQNGKKSSRGGNAAIIESMVFHELTEEQLERTVSSLRTLRIEQVTYAVLTGGEGLLEPDEWDHHDWHEPTMGCQLTTDVGVEFTLIWNHSFGCYGLEVFDQPIDAFLARTGEPAGPHIVTVGDHPLWSALLGREITGTEVVWMQWVSSQATPAWVRLDFAPSDRVPDEQFSVWFVAGCWREERFAIATDDVTVMFDKAMAEKAGLLPVDQ
jgi:hypothetical protein